VELLVVIAIIGVLVALLTPAVQGARETARRASCMNNLKQLGLAAQQHESAQGFFPTGGWGSQWVGDPDRGFTRRQPGGWIYNLLPYLEQASLHDLGKGFSDQNKLSTITTLVHSPLPLMNCPSRRSSITYQVNAAPAVNCGNIGTAILINTPVARSDYAVNCGSQQANDYGPGPATLAQGDDPSYPWPSVAGMNGVSYQRSEVKAAMITDGTSNTFFCGEKYLAPDFYFNGQSDGDNDAGMYVGFDNDIYRNTYSPPMPDTPGYDDIFRFGSAHSIGCQFAMCDGSTRRISYAIDPLTFQYLGSRNDGQAIDPSKL
jgi:type II secretory pathway pseudopilin PulG